MVKSIKYDNGLVADIYALPRQESGIGSVDTEPSYTKVVDENSSNAFNEKHDYGISASGSALTVHLTTYGLPHVAIWVKASGGGNVFTVQASRHYDTDYRTVDTITLSSAGEQLQIYTIPYKHVRVTAPAVSGVTNEIEISASR